MEGAYNLFRMWRNEYREVYEAAHGQYHDDLTAVFEQMEDLRVAAGALQRLNGLRRLGPAVAAGGLQRFTELERLFPCPVSADVLHASLEASPVCGECGFRLGTAAPVADARGVIRAVEGGIGIQQTRLARRVVSRLLVRPAEGSDAKVERFIEVVRAADLAGLAAVLDDEVVAFLSDLLADEPSGEGLLERLARSYPTVTSGNIDAAVEEFRRLLTDETAREGIVRLRNPGDTRPPGTNNA
jgi:hypothetical protein